MKTGALNTNLNTLLSFFVYCWFTKLLKTLEKVLSSSKVSSSSKIPTGFTIPFKTWQYSSDMSKNLS